MSAGLPQALFESLDAIANLEFKSSRRAQGTTAIRYQGARSVAGRPLSLAAAELLACVAPGATVLMTTGAGNPTTLPVGETDGPSGTAFLAYVLARRGHPIVLTADPHFLPPIVTSMRAVGLREGEGAGAFTVLPFPLGKEAGQAAAVDMLARFPQTGLAVFIEKPGPNGVGIFHTSGGKPKDPASVAHLHALAELARARGVKTLAVGDGGNEVGFGRVSPVIAERHPLGLDCGCPCHGGILNRTEVDCLVAASTSNWGGYAIAAALAMAEGHADWLPPRAAVAETVRESMKAGANDGYSGENVDTVDGIALVASEAVYDLMLETIQHSQHLS